MMRLSQQTIQTEGETRPLHPTVAPTSILVVDRDDDTRALYREAFALVGCGVIEARDGREALTKAFIEPLMLVVTELALPFVDGYALCEILRRDRITQDTPVLVVTSDACRDHADRAQRAGADVVLVKPTAIEDVVSEMQRLIADREGPRTVAARTPRRITTVVVADATTSRRTSRTQSYARFATTTPPTSPPSLVCPSCDTPLIYQQSHIGGVNIGNPEQWDHYLCARCGTFEYRQRTRRLRRVE